MNFAFVHEREQCARVEGGPAARDGPFGRKGLTSRGNSLSDARLAPRERMPFAAPLLLALTASPDAGPSERAIAPAVGVAAFATSVWLGLVAGQEEHAPKACRICTPPAADQAALAAIVWKRARVAYTLSDVALGVTSAWALGSVTVAAAADERLRATDAVIVWESTALAMMLNQIVKFEVARKRPDAPGDKSRPHHPQHNVSFFSGHATWSFASAVSAGTVAAMRGYRGAPVVLAGGLTLATATSYFRLAANRHWPSDVLAGAAVGSLIGALVPRLHLVSKQTSTASATGPGAAPTWITVGGVF